MKRLGNLYKKKNSSRFTLGSAKTNMGNMEIIMYHTVISPITILSHARYCGDHLTCIPRKTLRILDSSDLEVIEALLTILSNSRIMAYPLLQRIQENIPMELISEGDLADTFILARPPNVRWSPFIHFPLLISPYPCRSYPCFADQPPKKLRIETE